MRFVLIIVLTVLFFSGILDMSTSKHKYKEILSINWERVAQDVLENANEKWNCRKRVIHLASLMIKKQVQFNIVYGFYNKVHAHVWIEHRGKLLEPSIYQPDCTYYKICSLKIDRDSKLTRIICLLSRYIKKGGFL